MTRHPERRKHQRYQAKDGVMVFTFMTRNLGLIEDIGMDGLSFRYVAAASKSTPSQASLEESDRLDIVYGEVDFVLKGIPVKNVSDIETGPFSYDNMVFMRRRRCVQFGELTDDQIFKLKSFILTHTKAGPYQSYRETGLEQGLSAAW